MVSLNLHGDLGAEFGRNWNLDVSSVGEALYALEVNTKKFRKYLLGKEKENIKYQVLVNGNEIDGRNIEINNIQNSEFLIKNKNLKTIDVIPVLEGADPSFWAVLIVAIIVAVVVYFITPQPNFGDFREIDQGGKTSYLFSGPENVIGEGGPVPIGYGRLIIGSQVISAAYVVVDFDTESGEIARDEYGDLLPTFTNITDTRTNQGQGPTQTNIPDRGNTNSRRHIRGHN